MAQLAYVLDRKGTPHPYDREKISGPLTEAFQRIKVLPPDKDPKPIVEELTRRVEGKLNRKLKGDQDRVTKDEVVEAHRTVFKEITDSTNGEPLTPQQMLAFKEEFLIYAAGAALRERGIITADQFTADGIPREEASRIWQWNMDHDCHTVEKLNEWVLGTNGKRFEELVMASEKRYESDLLAAAQAFLDCGKDVRALIVCGPSSSGKTTTANRLRDLIATISGRELKLRPIEVDMFFKGGEEHAKIPYEIHTPHGFVHWTDKDYETDDAYDKVTLTRKLKSLMAGRGVRIPFYTFGDEAKVYPNATPFPKLEKNEVLVIDCLHGLHPSITAGIPEEMKFKLYIEAMNTLKDGDQYVRWTDIRMMRRMLRDVATRDHKVFFTLLHWHLVRKGEECMIPLVNTADVRINGGMPYDLPVLKRHVQRFFEAYLWIMRLNPHLGDALVRMERTYALLSHVEAANDQQISSIPANSLKREFVGGSAYDKKGKFPYGLLDTKMPEEI